MRRLLPLALLAALLVVLPWAGALGGGLAAPQRPASVPKSASWLGGPDGGVFFELSSTDSAKGRNYRGTIWRDHGRVWYRGPFHVQPANSAPVDVKKSKQFAGWLRLYPAPPIRSAPAISCSAERSVR